MSNSENEISYRQYVQRFIKTNELLPEDYDALETYRVYLKLLPAQARRIEQEVLRVKPSAGQNSSAEGDHSPNPSHERVTSLETGRAQPKGAPSNSASGRLSSSSVQSQPSSGSENLAQQNPGQVELKVGNKLPTNSAAQPKQPERVARVDVPAVLETDATLLPPQPPEQYFAHQQQYGQEFLQVLQSEGFNPGNETRERLRKLAIQLELSSSDVSEIEKNIMAEVCHPLSAAPPPTPEPPQTRPIEEKYPADLRPLFEELEGSLKAKEFRAADQSTFDILLKMIRPAQDWLDETALKSFSAPSPQAKNAIQEIDRLWNNYSDGKFGFSQQLGLYGFASVPSNDIDLNKERREHRLLALAFGRSTQWWIDGLEFFKYYNQLDFTTEAPIGHLPAFWFWKIPRSKVFQYGGLGFLRERGGCRVDAYTLPAYMYMLKKCGIKPH
jgi:hypothetical protein